MNLQVGDLYKFHDTDTGYNGLAIISGIDLGEISLYWFVTYYDNKPTSVKFASRVYVVDFFPHCWTKLS